MRKLLQCGFCLAVLVLAGCAKTPQVVDGGVSTTGVGDRAGFSAMDLNRSYTTKAPHEQVYYFAFNRYDIQPKYIPSIEAQAAYLKEHPGARVLVAGHADERGSREYNIALGEKRANALAQLLRMEGVKSNQVRVVSYGAERPQVLGQDETAYQYNRRVEFTYEAMR